MRDLVILFIHLLTTVARLARPGGVRSVVAESLLIKHQLLILNRSRQRAPNLRLSGSPRRRLVRAVYTAVPDNPFGPCSEAVDPPAPSPNPDQAQVPPALLAERQAQARSQGSVQRTHGGDCRHQATQSLLGLPAHCSADCLGVRHPRR